jgi:hypothetical protein
VAQGSVGCESSAGPPWVSMVDMLSWVHRLHGSPWRIDPRHSVGCIDSVWSPSVRRVSMVVGFSVASACGVVYAAEGSTATEGAQAEVSEERIGCVALLSVLGGKCAVGA